MIAALLAGVLVLAPTADTPTVDLIGRVSGFAKARTGELVERHSITVGPLPDYPDHQWFDADEALDTALDAWNRAAGWEVFIYIAEGPTDVTFDARAEELCPDYGGCTNFDTFASGWYEHVTISLWPWPSPDQLIAHELGHALGFRDVDLEHCPSDPYLGIMSYCRGAATMPDTNDFDPASLHQAGYRPVL